MEKQRASLIRGLTLADTTALVVGTVIGTGVFIKSAIMAQDAGSPLLVLAAWVAAGLLSLAGALTYAELGAMLPHAGGEYVYLRRSYGELAAFLFGWMRFVVAGIRVDRDPGSRLCHVPVGDRADGHRLGAHDLRLSRPDDAVAIRGHAGRRDRGHRCSLPSSTASPSWSAAGCRPS